MSTEHVHDPDLAICHCGTVNEAVVVAQEWITKMTAVDCPVWAFQVASAAAYLASRQLTHNSPEHIQGMKLAGIVVVEEASQVNIDELLQKAATERDKLYG